MADRFRIFRPATLPPGIPQVLDSIERLFASVAGRTSAATAYTVNAALTPEDGTALVDATVGAVAIALPPAESVPGRIYTVKKVDSSGNNVTIDPDGSETIDGAATKVISAQWASYTFQSNGTAWFIIS